MHLESNNGPIDVIQLNREEEGVATAKNLNDFGMEELQDGMVRIYNIYNTCAFLCLL